jgi:hypothetical protein
MPGQLVIPLYGLLFQGARAENAWSCRVTGFSASVLHVLYGGFGHFEATWVVSEAFRYGSPHLYFNVHIRTLKS